MAPLLLDENQVLTLVPLVLSLLGLTLLGGLGALMFNRRWFGGRLLASLLSLLLGYCAAVWSDEHHAEWSKLLLYTPFLISLFTVLFFPRKPPE